MTYRNEYGIEPLTAAEARYVAHADVNMMTRRHGKDDVGRLKAFVDSLGPGLPVLAEVAAERAKLGDTWPDGKEFRLTFLADIISNLSHYVGRGHGDDRAKLVEVAAQAIRAISVIDRKVGAK